jgi:tetratricopeptide (TPR) repeat protein
MVTAINHDYISEVPKPPSAAARIQVQCVTCHHGLTLPRPLNAVLAESLEKDGLEKSVALYHKLRGKYYGSGQYDFGETPLNQLTEDLLAQKENREGLAVMDLNFAENHPDSAWSYHMLAQTHVANGQTDKAIADYRKVLELHPDDMWRTSRSSPYRRLSERPFPATRPRDRNYGKFFPWHTPADTKSRREGQQTETCTFTLSCFNGSPTLRAK